MHCAQAGTGKEAAAILEAETADFDVILLDVSMPEQDGWQFIEDLREANDNTPVIFLSGNKGVGAKVKGLELGADDYIEKPFASEELLARMDAVVRRRNTLPVLSLGDLQLDLGHRTVRRGGVRIDLSPTEFDLLHCLVAGRGETISKSELLESVWGIHSDPGTKVVEVHISRLRAKIDRTEPHLIETVVRRGYRLQSGV
ncbi:MAG: two-component system OmpR family response regulator [Chlamydiales bacterium]|jgi:two-component system OmpR family response regulator